MPAVYSFQAVFFVVFFLGHGVVSEHHHKADIDSELKYPTSPAAFTPLSARIPSEVHHGECHNCLMRLRDWAIYLLLMSRY